MRAHRLRTAASLAALATGLSLGVVLPAQAHDVLTGTAPADGTTVARTPSAVVLTFDQAAIAMGTRIVVTGPSGEVGDGDPQLVDTTVRQPLRPGSPAGSYTVAWRVTSADGHPVTGTFAFTSRAAGAATATAGPSTDAPTASPGDPATGTGRSPVPGLVLGVVVVVVAGGVVALVRRRRTRTGGR